ncbi:hypothetical protein ACWGS9_35630, partial [Bradyrhizobium sp. Arg314]
GYTFKARVGASYFDAGSKLRFKIQYDRRAQIVIGTNPAAVMPVMASGSAGTANSNSVTWVSVATGAFVPSTASRIAVLGQSNGNGTAGQNLYIAPNNTYSGYACANTL